MSAQIGFITAAAQYGLGSILVKPLRAIGPLVMQVVVEEVHSDDLQITDHPVELGAMITDHSYRLPAELTIRGGWSNSPTVAGLFAGLVAGVGSTGTGIQSLVTGNEATQIRDWYKKLLKLQADRIPFDVYTGKRIYKNMLIKGMTVTTDEKYENSLFVTVSLREVLIVSTQILTVPATMANQADPSATAQPVNNGTKSVQPTNQFQEVQ